MLLCEALGHDHNRAAVEEVEHPVVHSLVLRPELVDPTAEVLGLGAPDVRGISILGIVRYFTNKVNPAN